MEMMRSKGKLTRLLVLREIVLEDPNDQRSIADSLDITPQAVSEYLKKMGEEGLVDLSVKSPKATVEGVEFLQRGLLVMKSFIDGTIERLDIIRSIDAIAEVDVTAGETVGLFMKNGLLYCSPGEVGSSSGKADHGGRAGDVIMISDLSGMVEMPESMLYLVEILPARSGGGNKRLSSKALESVIGPSISADPPRIAALDIEAVALMTRSGIAYDLELPGARAVKNGLDRGLDVVCLGTPFSISRLKDSPDLADLKRSPVLIRGADLHI